MNHFYIWLQAKGGQFQKLNRITGSNYINFIQIQICPQWIFLFITVNAQAVSTAHFFLIESTIQKIIVRHNYQW